MKLSLEKIDVHCQLSMYVSERSFKGLTVYDEAGSTSFACSGRLTKKKKSGIMLIMMLLFDGVFMVLRVRREPTCAWEKLMYFTMNPGYRPRFSGRQNPTCTSHGLPRLHHRSRSGTLRSRLLMQMCTACTLQAL